MSLSLMAVPVFLDTTPTAPHLFRQWLSMYNYGFPVLPTISIATCSLYVAIALRQRAAGMPDWFVYAAAGLVTVIMVPFTWVFLWPTNNTIMKLEEETRSIANAGTKEVEGTPYKLKEAQALVKVWSRIHFTRSFFPLIGALIGLSGLLKDVK